LWPFVVALVGCVLFVPLAIYLSRRFGWIAQPGGRHAHSRPTPTLGGLAMFVGFALAVAIFLPQYGATPGVLLVSGLSMAAGVIAIVALVLMLAAGQLGQLEVVKLSGALAGCCAGFLMFNFPPARIFMGDSGAHFLGIALGMISILGVAKVAVAFALAAP